jgi:hypothetical protein
MSRILTTPPRARDGKSNRHCPDARATGCSSTVHGSLSQISVSDADRRRVPGLLRASSCRASSGFDRAADGAMGMTVREMASHCQGTVPLKSLSRCQYDLIPRTGDGLGAVRPASHLRGPAGQPGSPIVVRPVSEGGKPPSSVLIITGMYENRSVRTCLSGGVRNTQEYRRALRCSGKTTEAHSTKLRRHTPHRYTVRPRRGAERASTAPGAR